ncbi:uncharacterized protein LOC131071573 isoform X3 [Cryptomeria japonica]|uniref:uncharacterized protein LOC131071573 isoform X3 n=1 Tax=Cryptomeria japonica TaxID=3369 RepID=UPI0027DA354B|nr:uncharacterized protein LOC131071573 isoform X3 [Cryptomeria japonica]
MAGVVAYQYVRGCPSFNKSLSVRAQLKEDTSSISRPVDPSSPSSSPPDGFKPPEPRRFYVRGDQWLKILGASLALPLRLGTGALVLGYKASWVRESEIPPNQYTFLQVAGHKLVETSNLGPRPDKPIEIYEFESCPFCRKVDPNTGVSMYESDDIIKYLVEKYGDGKVPLMLSLGLFTTLTAGLAMIGRPGKGSVYTPSKVPEKPLELWAYEGIQKLVCYKSFFVIKVIFLASPFCKIVRETLVELEVPHIYHSTARGSPHRQSLFDRTGLFQAPYLEDPNTGVKMFESAEIVDYVRATYAIPVPQV